MVKLLYVFWSCLILCLINSLIYFLMYWTYLEDKSLPNIDGRWYGYLKISIVYKLTSLTTWYAGWAGVMLKFTGIEFQGFKCQDSDAHQHSTSLFWIFFFKSARVKSLLLTEWWRSFRKPLLGYTNRKNWQHSSRSLARSTLAMVPSRSM